jgi:hypothetical protein
VSCLTTIRTCSSLVFDGLSVGSQVSFIRLHDATNQSKGTRVVLFLDVDRRPLTWYMRVFHKIAIFATNRMEPLVSMRKKAVVDENKVLSTPGRRLAEQRTISQLYDRSIEIGE